MPGLDDAGWDKGVLPAGDARPIKLRTAIADSAKKVAKQAGKLTGRAADAVVREYAQPLPLPGTPIESAPPTSKVGVTTLPKGYQLERSIHYSVKHRGVEVAKVQVAADGPMSRVGKIEYTPNAEKIPGLTPKLYGQIRHDTAAPVVPQQLIDRPGVSRIVVGNQSNLPVPSLPKPPPPPSVMRILTSPAVQGAQGYAASKARGETDDEALIAGAVQAAPATAMMALPSLQRAGEKIASSSSGLTKFSGTLLAGSAQVVRKVAVPAALAVGAMQGRSEDTENHRRGIGRGVVRSLDPTAIVAGLRGTGMGLGERLYNRAFGAPQRRHDAYETDTARTKTFPGGKSAPGSPPANQQQPRATPVTDLVASTMAVGSNVVAHVRSKLSNIGNGNSFGDRIYNKLQGQPRSAGTSTPREPVTGAYMNDTARARASAPSPNDAPMARPAAVPQAQHGRESYATKDGRSVDATPAQAQAWAARRKD